MNQKRTALGYQPGALQNCDNNVNSVPRTSKEGNGFTSSSNTIKLESDRTGRLRTIALQVVVKEHIPEMLRSLPQWVCWESRVRPNKTKPAKVPIQASGKQASTTDSTTWAGFEEVTNAVPRIHATGVGFVFAAGGGITGVDLDHCRDADTGEIAPWARAYLDHLRSYTEISPSGTGLHVIIGGTKPALAGCKRAVQVPGAAPDAAVEIYDKARYFAMTGLRIDEYDRTVMSRQGELDAICVDLWPPRPERTQAPFSPRNEATAGSYAPTDEEVLKVMFAGPGGASREALFNGDLSAYDGDHSRADMALCSYLWRYCDDVVQVERLWLASRLGQRKKTVSREDYRRRTIDAALAGGRDRFEWHQPHSTTTRSDCTRARKGGASSGETDGSDTDTSLSQHTTIGEMILEISADTGGEALDTALRPILERVTRCSVISAEAYVKDICKRFKLTKRSVDAALAGVRRATKPPKACSVRNTSAIPDDGRPHIEATFDYQDVNDAVIEALTRDPAIYQRDRALVTIIGANPNDKSLPDGTKIIEGEPVIHAVSVPTLEERCSASAIFHQESTDEKNKVHRYRVPVPTHCGKQIHARGEWRGIRYLVGLTDFPVLAHSGVLVTEIGYHAETGYYLGSGAPRVQVPNHPTQDDAQMAARSLLALVEEFPWKDEISQAGWLAVLLSPLARPAINGATPAFLVKSNTRKTGKTLLLDVSARILSGRDMPAFRYAENDDEMEKILVSIARMGLAFFNWDNIRNGGLFGGAVLDRWIASTRVAGRTLGVNETPIYDWRTVQCATGNNVGTRGDTDPRCIHIVLESELENPETRTGFRIADIGSYVLEHRSKYLSDALTILRAYAAAGRPAQGGRTKGRYEEWCSVVRDAIMYAGLADCEREPHDPSRPVDADRDLGSTMFRALRENFGDTPFVVRDIMQSAWPGDSGPDPNLELRDALSSMDYRKDRPSPQKVGRWLQGHRDCWLDGLSLRGEKDRHLRKTVWRTIAHSSGVDQTAECVADSNSKPQLDIQNGGCAGGSADVADFSLPRAGEKIDF